MKSPVIRLILIALNVIALDQVTKWMVTERLALGEQREWIEGFFRLVHWGNTGAAWSMFRGNNHILAGVALIAVVVLFMARKQFDVHRPIGQIALGLMFGGIIGNLIDRFRIGHVVDFISLHYDRWYWPAFNLADSAITAGAAWWLLSAFFGNASTRHKASVS